MNIHNYEELNEFLHGLLGYPIHNDNGQTFLNASSEALRDAYRVVKKYMGDNDDRSILVTKWLEAIERNPNFEEILENSTIGGLTQDSISPDESASSLHFK